MIVAAPAERNPGAGERRRAGPLQVVKAVLSAFIGIRKSAGHDSDMTTITPVQAIVTGIIAAAVLVASVALLVHFIMSRLGQA